MLFCFCCALQIRVWLPSPVCTEEPVSVTRLASSPASVNLNSPGNSASDQLMVKDENERHHVLIICRATQNTNENVDHAARCFTD